MFVLVMLLLIISMSKGFVFRVWIAFVRDSICVRLMFILLMVMGIVIDLWCWLVEGMLGE